MTPTNPALVAPAASTDGAVPMSPSEALDIVHEFACLNQIDELEASGDAVLEAQARWQRAALDRLGLLLHEHSGAIDVHLALPSLALCAPVADWLCGPERDTDPGVPSNAVRICLELAQVRLSSRTSAARSRSWWPAAGARAKPSRSCARSRACTPKPWMRRSPSLSGGARLPSKAALRPRPPTSRRRERVSRC